MRYRIRLSRFLIRLGEFIQSLPVVVMRPNDLVEFSRQAYARPSSINHWCGKNKVNSGLTGEEAALLAYVPLKKGQLLLLGVGGGREAIPLSKMGFQVTGIDSVPAMVEMAKKNAAEKGTKIVGKTQDISKIDVPSGSYDIVFLSAAMYSCIPTRNRRVEMLKRIRKALKPRGLFVCQFQWGKTSGPSRKGELARKAIAFLTLGNLRYEKGDLLWLKVEFVHAFFSEDEIRSEFRQGGFEVLHIHVPGGIRGGAVLRKDASILT